MKVRYFVSILILGVLFIQCTDEDILDFDDPSVPVFVQMVKTNSYVQEGASGIVEVPIFKKSDIPNLLKYAKDNTPVRGFPINPASSVKAEYYYLSQCLLWTIEKVRIGGYPSLTPSLYKAIEDEELPVEINTTDEIMKVWELYNEWWKKVEDESSSVDYFRTDPLEGSPYSWQNIRITDKPEP